MMNPHVAPVETIRDRHLERPAASESSRSRGVAPLTHSRASGLHGRSHGELRNDGAGRVQAPLLVVGFERLEGGPS